MRARGSDERVLGGSKRGFKKIRIALPSSLLCIEETRNRFPNAKLDSPRLRVVAMLTGRRRNWKAAENPVRIADVSAIAPHPSRFIECVYIFCVICAFPLRVRLRVSWRP